MTGDAATSSVDVDRPDLIAWSVSREKIVTGLCVPGAVNDKKVSFVLDTGSSVTIISKRIFDRLPVLVEVERTSQKLLLADGSEMPTTGWCNVNIDFGSCAVQWRVLVAEIQSDALLGLDFIKEHGPIDAKNGFIMINGEKVEFEDEVCPDEKSCLVLCKRTVVVPPRSEAVLEGLVPNCRGKSTSSVTLPVESFRSKNLCLAQVLVNPQEKVVPFRVLNPTEEPVMLLRNERVAVASPVRGVDPEAFALINENETSRRESQLLQIEQNSELTECQRQAICRALQQFPDLEPAATLVKPPDLPKKPPDNVAHDVPEHLQDLYDRSRQSLFGEQDLALKRLLCEYSDVFSAGPFDLGRCGIMKHHIDTGDAKPIKLPPRKVPMHLQKEVDAEIQKLLDAGLIRPSNSPWSTCIVPVRKSDGSLRICQDLRAVNNVTRKDAFPLPSITACLDALSGATWFSSLDLASGFHQIELDEESIPKTAFSTRMGLFEYLMLPFGLTGGPATCERLVENVMDGLQWVNLLIYIDDLISYGCSFDTALANIEEVLKRLRQANLKLKPKKCILFQPEVSFLGHRVSRDGVSTCPKKIEKVVEWPRPKNVSELRSFLGLCSYYRRFVLNYSAVADPLHRLTEKDAKFDWTDQCEDTFQKLKLHLTTAPILAYPNSDDEFILDTDASNTGIGGVLSQVQDGKERVIAYASRSLSKTERRYCVTRREMLALVEFVKHFKSYLLAKPFRARVDHASLRWLLSFREPEGQVARWLQQIAVFDFQIEYRPGKQHGNSDALSRMPCGQCGSGVTDDEDLASEDLRARAREMLKQLKECKKNFKSDESPIVAARRIVCCALAEDDEPSGDEEPANESEVWLDGWTSEFLRQKQEEDDDIRPVLEAVREGTKPAWQQCSEWSQASKAMWSHWELLRLHEDVLYKSWLSADGLPIKAQLVLPQCLKNDVLQKLHDSPTAGHLGIDRTVAAVKSRFYWYGFKTDVQSYIHRCNLCTRRKTSPKRLRAPLQQYLVGEPMERIAIDISGKWPLSNKKNQYILVVADYFTKYVECYPLPNQEASTVANVLVNEFLSRYGFPRKIHSDQGSNFNSKLFAEVCQLLDIEKTRTSGYRPQSDGLVERFNRTIETMLSMFVAQNQRDWDEKLPLLTMAYRSTPQASTGFTPNLLMYLRELRLPIDLMFQGPPGEAFHCHTEFVDNLRNVMTSAYRLVRRNLKKSAVRQKFHYDVGVKKRNLAVGSFVWLFNPAKTKGRSPKLSIKWMGPYLVREKIGVLCKIQLSPKSRTRVVHQDRLLAYTGQPRQSWIVQ